MNADCIREPIGFSRLKSRNVVADFAGGTLTSDAGGLLLREVDRRIGLVDALTRCIADPRDPARITHELRTLIAQRLFAIALGYEDGNDHHDLRNDPLLQLLTERGVDPARPLASPATLCRLENGVDRETLVRISEVFLEQFIAGFDAPPEELILDFDATDDPTHGTQEGRFFHGYYDHYCFLPLYVFCGEQLLTAYLRPSNIDAAKHSRAILKLLVTRLREAFPDVRIVVRADSGFCRWRLMRWCDRRDVKYVLGLARNASVQRLAEPWITQAESRFGETGQKQRLFGEVQYAAETWDRSRRVIIKAEHGGQGANPRFLVTNLTGEPQHLYDRIYCQRGEMENRIKEQQLWLFADRTSAHTMRANQLRLWLSSVAYVLVDTLRRFGLAGTQWARAQVGTIRTRLFKLAGLVTVSVRRVVVAINETAPVREDYTDIVDRLRERLPSTG